MKAARTRLMLYRRRRLTSAGHNLSTFWLNESSKANLFLNRCTIQPTLDLVPQAQIGRNLSGTTASVMRLRLSNLPAMPAWPAASFLFCASPWLDPRFSGAGQQHQRPWLQQCMRWASFQEACVPVQRPHTQGPQIIAHSGLLPNLYAYRSLQADL